MMKTISFSLLNAILLVQFCQYSQAVPLPKTVLSLRTLKPEDERIYFKEYSSYEDEVEEEEEVEEVTKKDRGDVIEKAVKEKPVKEKAITEFLLEVAPVREVKKEGQAVNKETVETVTVEEEVVEEMTAKQVPKEEVSAEELKTAEKEVKEEAVKTDERKLAVTETVQEVTAKAEAVETGTVKEEPMKEKAVDGNAVKEMILEVEALKEDIVKEPVGELSVDPRFKTSPNLKKLQQTTPTEAPKIDPIVERTQLYNYALNSLKEVLTEAKVLTEKNDNSLKEHVTPIAEFLQRVECLRQLPNTQSTNSLVLKLNDILDKYDKVLTQMLVSTEYYVFEDFVEQNVAEELHDSAILSRIVKFLHDFNNEIDTYTESLTSIENDAQREMTESNALRKLEILNELYKLE